MYVYCKQDLKRTYLLAQNYITHDATVSQRLLLIVDGIENFIDPTSGKFHVTMVARGKQYRMVLK